MADAGSRLAFFVMGLLLLSFFMRCPSAQSPSISAEINSTRSYVDEVNESGYLVFSPNLTAAYGYLNNATNMSHTDPAYAQVLLGKARESAEVQLANIDRYRTLSLYVMAVASVLLVVLLAKLMRSKPSRKAKK